MKVFAVLRGVLLLLALAAVGGLESAHASHYLAPARRVYTRCEGYWVPDGVIAGPTAGYPYYGWCGYPYVPYKCVRRHHPRYRAYRDASCARTTAIGGRNLSPSRTLCPRRKNFPF